MHKLMSMVAIVFHTIALLSAASGAWVVYKVFGNLMAGGEPEVISMIFAIGLAVIPYCFASGFSRMVAVEREMGD